MSQTLNSSANDLKCLEHPTLKVPYEILNKKFRAAQKNIDREVQRVQQATSELETILQNSTNKADIVNALDAVKNKLLLIKRKSEENIAEEVEATKICKMRLDHLKESSDEIFATSWKKKRLDRMLVEYFLRSGYYETALKLANHSNIEDLTNIELFQISRDVEISLMNQDTSKCLNWCNENKSRLKKMKSNLEFNLRQQEFIELVRKDQRIEAIKHARRYLATCDEPHYSEIKECMCMLAFACDLDNNPYKHLLDVKRWDDLVKLFRQENFRLYHLNNESVFLVVLQAGLSVLKTPQCYTEGPEKRNLNCPVCSDHLNSLASRLPFAHCSHSRLVCHISSLPINEHNPPMMLPNGYVYGLDSLLEMAAQNDGKIICPRTLLTFEFSEAEKVFVM